MTTMKYDIPILDHNIKFLLWQVKMQVILVQIDLEYALLRFDKMPSSLSPKEIQGSKDLISNSLASI